MSAAIGPGDWVECVDAEDTLVLGRLYCVEALGPGGECRNCGPVPHSIELLGDDVLPNYGYCACQFRPIYRPNSEILELLKQPAPEREPENA